VAVRPATATLCLSILSARLALRVALDCSKMEAEKDQAFSLQNLDPFEHHHEGYFHAFKRYIANNNTF